LSLLRQLSRNEWTQTTGKNKNLAKSACPKGQKSPLGVNSKSFCFQHVWVDYAQGAFFPLGVVGQLYEIFDVEGKIQTIVI
jgi:hypothetical protein